jgi:hypothetical protein
MQTSHQSSFNASYRKRLLASLASEQVPLRTERSNAGRATLFMLEPRHLKGGYHDYVHDAVTVPAPVSIFYP